MPDGGPLGPASVILFGLFSAAAWGTSDFAAGLASRRVSVLALVLAAWIHYLRGVAEDGGAFQPDDPLRGPLQASARAPDADEAVRRVFRQPAIFGDLAENAALQKKVAACLRRLQSGGTLGALAWMKGSEAVHLLHDLMRATD